MMLRFEGVADRICGGGWVNGTWAGDGLRASISIDRSTTVELFVNVSRYTTVPWLMARKKEMGAKLGDEKGVLAGKGSPVI